MSQCRSTPLTHHDLLDLATILSSTGASYRAIAIYLKLREPDCVTHIAGGVAPLGCPGTCRGRRS